MPKNTRVVKTWGDVDLADIPARTQAHLEALLADPADPSWDRGDMPVVVLTTIGRRSGKEHTCALSFWWDPDDVPVVVASFGLSTKHPAWFLNLRDRDANPTIGVQIRDRVYRSAPEIIDESPEYERWWAMLMEDRPWYADYQVKTTRRFPIIRLVEA